MLLFVGQAVLLGKRVFLRSWYGLFCAPGPDSSATISAGTSSSVKRQKGNPAIRIIQLSPSSKGKSANSFDWYFSGTKVFTTLQQLAYPRSTQAHKSCTNADARRT